MRKLTISILFLITVLQVNGQDYLCFYTMHVGIDETLKEHKRQQEMHASQNRETALMMTNKREVDKIEKSYTLTQKRLKSVGLFIDTYFLLGESAQIIKEIKYSQGRFIDELKNTPALAFLALKEEYDFVNKTQLLSRYIAGLILTGNALNQLDNVDRKVIFDFIIQELRAIEAASRNAHLAVVFAKQNLFLKKVQWKNWANREVDLMKDIMNKAKQL